MILTDKFDMLYNTMPTGVYIFSHSKNDNHKANINQIFWVQESGSHLRNLVICEISLSLVPAASRHFEILLTQTVKLEIYVDAVCYGTVQQSCRERL